MKVSRKDGILPIETKKPFKVSIGGSFEDRTDVVLHDVTANTEDLALDLEQLFLSAIASMGDQSNGQKQNASVVEEQNKQNEEFFKNNSPKIEEIEEQAEGLKMAIMFNKVVKASEVLKAFKEMALAGAVGVAGDQAMTEPRWNSIDRRDKEYICYMYCAFFVNPLERL